MRLIEIPEAVALHAALSVLLILPWLNPYAPGPSPAVVPWLCALFCFAALLLLEAAGCRLAKRWADVISCSWLVVGLVSSVLALCQYFDIEALFAPWINSAEPGQAFANLRQRNQFASLTNMALAVLLAWTTHRSNVKLAAGASSGLVAAAALLAVGNAASASRTGVVQLLLLCVLFAGRGGWHGRSGRFVQLISAAAVVAYLAAAALLPVAIGLNWQSHGLFARLQIGDEPCASRITLWSNVLHLIAQKPWLGWGWGELDYAHFITLYDGPRFCDILDNAHNLPLHLAVELGVPFAVLVCGGFAWWVLRQKPWAERDASRQMAWAVMAVILLHSMVEYPLWYGPFQMAFGMCLVLLWRQKPPLELQNSLENLLIRPAAPISRARAAMLIIAPALLLFVIYAAWDYHRISQIYLTPESRDARYRDDTLAKIRSSWLFADQVRFAELMITPLSAANAAWTLHTANALLHYSPEPRVIEKLIESAVMLGRDDEALAYLARYRAAFPKEHALWAKANAKANTNANADSKPN